MATDIGSLLSGNNGHGLREWAQRDYEKHGEIVAIIFVGALTFPL
jgi:hypothetical protein